MDVTPIYCVVCENKCSPLANACPSCGHPLSAVMRETPISRPRGEVKAFNLPHSEDAFICANPNCDYRGTPKRIAKGSALVFILLLCLWIIPGIVYGIVMSGYRYVCPKCGLTHRSDLIR